MVGTGEGRGGEGRGEGTPLYTSYIGMCGTKGFLVFEPFWSEIGYRF